MKEDQYRSPTINARLSFEFDVFFSGDSLLIVEIPDQDIGVANRIARSCAALLELEDLPFVSDIVPAMRTVGVHYLPHQVPCPDGVAPCDVVESRLRECMGRLEVTEIETRQIIEIPVCYGGEFGPDIDDVARSCSLSIAEVISLHSDSIVEVMMIGFAPGHPYIGVQDSRLAIPRRMTPRTAVPPGTIAVANRQSVIYPNSSPSGWNVIGRTPLHIFEPKRDQPCLLRAGDKVRFVPVNVAEYMSAAEQVEKASRISE